jgi:general secretion pathway protein G
MVVIAIIGLLAAIALPKFSEVSASAKVANVQGNLSTNRTAIAMYYAKSDSYPSLATAQDALEGVSTSDGSGVVATFTDFYGKNVMESTPASTALAENFIANNDIVATTTTTGNAFSASTVNGGWAYRLSDGAIRANLPDNTYLTSEGVDWTQF